MAHPQAGKPAPASVLVDLPALLRAYLDAPDANDPAQRVAFGTSGHRGSALKGSFNQAHILAIVQAVCEYRSQNAISGPLYLGMDTHALSAPAQRTALEVLAANAVHTRIQRDGGYTPTPVISRAILMHNRAHGAARADGLVITPSHNPPADGGIKYNPPDGGPADTDVTGWIEARANALLAQGNREVKRLPYAQALAAGGTREDDFASAYIADLGSVIDMEAIRAAGVKIGVDPLGGAAVAYWKPIAAHYGLNIDVVNPKVDPAFGFMTLDHDGKIRMDCSSPYAMASLVGLKQRFDIAWANDADADRHGIVTPSRGLDESQPLPRSSHPLSAHAPAAVAGDGGGRQNPGVERADRPRGRRAGAASGRSAGGIQVVFKGGCWTADSASAARRARARVFCAATARSGPPTRTALSSGCWPRKSPLPAAEIRGVITRNWPRSTAARITYASMRLRRRRRKPRSRA